LVENVTVAHSPNRAFVPHGSHGITFNNIAALDITLAAFWWDDPGTNETCTFQEFCTLDNSNDIHVDGLTVDGVGHDGSSAKFRLSGVVLGAGSGNSIINSTVRNVGGSKDCSGYMWPEGANGNRGGNVWIFENNVGSSNCHGIFVWQNDANLHIIDGFTGGGVDHGAYGNNYLYRNLDVPYLEVHAQGWAVEDSSLGSVSLRGHQQSGPVDFDNVTIDTLSVQDANGSRGVTLTITNTNITCTDVVWTNPHPETVVVIDGVACVNNP